MHRTEQQVAADQLLEEAIRTGAEAYGFGKLGEFVGDWLVIAELPQLDDSPTQYALFMTGRVLPEHRARGLHRVAGEVLDEVYADDDEEDD